MGISMWKAVYNYTTVALYLVALYVCVCVALYIFVAFTVGGGIGRLRESTQSAGFPIKLTWADVVKCKAARSRY